jgi:anaerobic selenocysteine-containing dehydrogenase
MSELRQVQCDVVGGDRWKQTACILCSRNCGLEVQLDGARLAKIRGDERHPLSAGYLCQKAARLDYYQNHQDRLSTPLRRRSDGSFEAVSWELAVREIARQLVAIRRQHGGRAFAYYGGGGQGNHLGGAYGRALLEAMGSRFHYSALAQEKTGDFWVNGRLFGKQTCHTTEGIEHAEVVLFIGANPWQAHGIPNARATLRELAADPRRTMIVVDPQRSETAALAKHHLRVRPGTDAFLLSAILATMVRAGWTSDEFLSAHTTGFEAVKAALLEVPIEAHAARAGVPLAEVQLVARLLGTAKSASVRVDLGLQQSLHSTLNSYLEKLLSLLPGQFGREGCNTLHTFLMPLIGHSDPVGPGSRSWSTAATGMAEIGKLFPPNVLPAEIDNDRPDRVRALFVDSANPALSGADTQAYRRAFARLELSVTVDVALTETARLSHWVLPASSQLEKWEATFFNLEAPTQVAHLRRPLLPPLAGTLPEPEIYRRLLVAMGALPADFPLLRGVARLDRAFPKARLFPLAFRAALELRPRLRPMAAHVLRLTLGRVVAERAGEDHRADVAAVLWGAAHAYALKHTAAVRRAGLAGDGADLGEALFTRLFESRSGTKISTHEHPDAFGFIRHPDHRIHLEIPEMLAELRALPQEREGAAQLAYPLLLVAGERRAYTANLIYRDPGWRKNDGAGALHIHPEDAEALGLAQGARAICESQRGSLEVQVAVTDAVQRGVVTLPNGYGTEHPTGAAGGPGEANGRRAATGPAINLLTDSAWRDATAGTPFHKHVRVRLRPAS